MGEAFIGCSLFRIDDGDLVEGRGFGGGPFGRDRGAVRDDRLADGTVGAGGGRRGKDAIGAPGDARPREHDGSVRAPCDVRDGEDGLAVIGVRPRQPFGAVAEPKFATSFFENVHLTQ